MTRQRLKNTSEPIRIYNESNLFSDYKGVITVTMTTIGMREETRAVLAWGDYVVHASSGQNVHVLVRFKDGKECFKSVRSYSSLTVEQSGRLVENLFGEED